jgi:hypothetical protein
MGLLGKAGIWFAEQSGFAGAVSADEAEAFAFARGTGDGGRGTGDGGRVTGDG